MAAMNFRALLLAALVCAAAAAAVALDATTVEPVRPVWPQEFQVSWDFEVPYIEEYQREGLTYKYQAWRDSRLGRQRVVRDGVETVIILVPVNRMYEVFPAYDHLTCWEDEIHGGTGPTLAGGQQQQEPEAQQEQELQVQQEQQQRWSDAQLEADRPLAQQRRRLQDKQQQEQQRAEGGGRYLFDWEKKQPGQLLSFVLPDLSEERWEYVGSEVFKETGESAHVYEWDLTQGGISEMKYRFYVTRQGVPLRLWMMGTNLYTGGHKDEYIATYYNFSAGSIPDSTFQLPEGMLVDDCKAAAPDALAAAAAEAAAAGKAPAPTWQPGALLRQFALHMPSVHWGHAAYDSFVHRFGRRHKHADEYHARQQVFVESSKFVDGWTALRQAEAHADGASAATNGSSVPRRHSVVLNHLADWTREEYLSLVKPDRPTQRLLAAAQPGVHVHKVNTPSHMIPAEVIWRGTPADSPVKDQAACGSCWSFSSVGAIEAAWYRETGKQLLFSEQHMIDCGWEAGNSGCYGGDQIRALNWVFKRGALAAQADYVYQGINNFCRTDVRQEKFKGHWVLVQGGEEAVKEALLTKGPFVVSIDASDDSFRFYSGGLYSNPDCHTDPKELDHAVILSGYGTTEDGQPYWLVKNIWSPYWGEEGYLRVTRQPNDCGVASEPIYIELQRA